MLVKNKKTGQVGEIQGNSFDPNLFEPVNQTPSQPQQKNFIQQAGDFLAPKISAIGNGIVNTAAMAGDYIDYQAPKLSDKQAAAQSYTQHRNNANDALKQFGFDANKPSGQQFDAKQYAKGTAQGAAEAASYAVPAGKTYKAAAGLGAISGALRGASEADNLGDLPGKVTSGAIGGSTGGVIFKGAADLIGNLLEKSGANMALRSLRPSKTQITNFNKDTGENLTDFVVKNKLFDKGTDQVDQLIKPLQDGYNELATNSSSRVDPQKVSDAFDSKISELEKIPNTKIQAIAAQLKAEKELVLAHMGDGKGIDYITEIRRMTDKLIPDSKFGKDPVTAGTDTILRGIYKDVIDTSTGGKTAKLGEQLQNLYAFRDIAETQANIGKGNLPAGLLPIIAGSGGFASGKDMNERMRNAAILYGVVTGINNPKVIQAITSTLLKSGSMLQNTNMPQLIGRNVGNSLGTMSSSLLGNGNQQDQTQSTNGPVNIGQNNSQTSPEQNNTQIPTTTDHGSSISQGIGSSPQDTAMGGQTPQGLGSTPKPLNQYGATVQELRQLQQIAIMKGATKQEARFEKLIKIEEDNLKENKLKDKSAGQKIIDNSIVNISEMKNAYGLGTKNSLSAGNNTIGLGGLRTRGGVESKKQLDQTYVDRLNSYKNMTSFAAGIINQARGAGVLNADEYRVMLDNMPNEYTSETQAKNWFNNLDRLIKKMDPATVGGLPANPQDVSFDSSGLGAQP